MYLGDVVIVLGGCPTTVRDRLRVPLGAGRDQVATRATPEFVALRSRVFSQIRDDAVAP